MNIYLSSPAFCFNSITNNFQSFSKFFDYWEIVSEHRNDILIHKEELKEVMGSYNMGLRVHGPFSDINTATPNRAVREFGQQRILDNIRVCSELGIEVITVHPGYRNPLTRFGPELVPDLNKEFAQRLSHAQEEFGVKVGLENMPYGKKLDCSDLDRYEYVAGETSLFLTLDIGHAFAEGALEGFYSIKDRIVNIHVHDNMGEHDEHLVVGEGTCNFGEVFSKLLPISNPFFKDSLVIESNSLEDAVKGRKHLEEVLASLDD